MIDIWIPLSLSGESVEKIKRLRETLSENVPEVFIEETDPHISIIPGAKIPEEQYDSLEDTVAEIELPTDTIEIEGLSVYPLDAPDVILLDATVDVDEIRESLVEEIYDLGGELVYSPVDPHITLFKQPPFSKNTQQLSYSIGGLHRRLEAYNQDQTIETHWNEQEYQIEVVEYDAASE